MSITRQELIEKVKNNDVKFFQDIYFQWSPGRQFKEVWSLNMGDGNEWTVALEFTDFKITIVLEGYYSSHGDSEFENVGFGIPFEFKENRYKIANKEELRDLRIEEILS